MVEVDFDVYCKEVMVKFKKKVLVEYIIVFGIEYFIEVVNIDFKNVFVFWVKIFGIKKVFWFYILEVIKFISECD